MLLQHIAFKDSTPINLFHLVTEATGVILVSDGAADHFQGAAGWVLAIGKDCCMCTCQCPVPGYDPPSYQAEGYGMIGSLLCLHHLCLCSTHLNLIPIQTIYFNNEGLEKKVNKLFSFQLAATASALHIYF
jgi:hypothetical protein